MSHFYESKFDKIFKRIISEAESLGTLGATPVNSPSTATPETSAKNAENSKTEKQSETNNKESINSNDFYNLLKNTISSDGTLDGKKAESLLSTLSQSSTIKAVPKDKLPPADRNNKQVFNFSGGQLVFTNQGGKYKVQLIPAIKTTQDTSGTIPSTPDSDSSIRKLIDSLFPKSKA